LPEPGPHTTGRRPAAPISPRHGVRNARSASRSEHISVERAKGTDSAGSAPNSFLSPGAPACLGSGIRTTTIRQAAVHLEEGRKIVSGLLVIRPERSRIC